MIGDVIATLNIALDRFEESHHAALIAGDRLGTQAMASEESVFYALTQSQECNDGAKAATDLVFRTGPDIGAGQRIAQAAVDAEQKIQELRMFVEQAHARVDEISNILLNAVQIAADYRDRLLP